LYTIILIISTITAVILEPHFESVQTKAGFQKSNIF